MILEEEKIYYIKLANGEQIVTKLIVGSDDEVYLHQPAYLNIMRHEQAQGLSIGIIPYVSDLITDTQIFAFNEDQIVSCTAEVTDTVKEIYRKFWKAMNLNESVESDLNEESEEADDERQLQYERFLKVTKPTDDESGSGSLH